MKRRNYFSQPGKLPDRVIKVLQWKVNTMTTIIKMKSIRIRTI